MHCVYSIFMFLSTLFFTLAKILNSQREYGLKMKDKTKQSKFLKMMHTEDILFLFLFGITDAFSSQTMWISSMGLSEWWFWNLITSFFLIILMENYTVHLMVEFIFLSMKKHFFLFLFFLSEISIHRFHFFVDGKRLLQH